MIGINFNDLERESTTKYVDRYVADLQFKEIPAFKRFKIYAKKLFYYAINPGAERIDTVDELVDDAWVEKIAKLNKECDYRYVLVEYVFYSKFFLAFPDYCLKILDTHDVFTDRAKKFAKTGISKGWISLPKREEKMGLRRADVIIAIQVHEQEYFEMLLTGNNIVVTVGHKAVPVILQEDRAKLNGFGILASDNSLNVKSVQWFLDNIFDKLVNIQPDVKFYVGGQLCFADISWPKNVVLMGVVNDPQVLYEKCLFTINPLMTGTGLKIKTLESLSYGRAVIGFQEAARGLESMIGKCIFVAKDSDEFVELISARLHSKSNCAAEGFRAIQEVRQYNSTVDASLNSIFEKIKPAQTN